MSTDTVQKSRKLGIVTYPAPVLRRETERIDRIDDEVVDLVDKMTEAMIRAEGIGLAAPQVGTTKNVVTVDVEDDFHVLINPEIVAKSEQVESVEEGCLSIPGAEGEVSRSTEVTVKAINLDGEEFTLDADGLLARVLQHELDHLEGVLFIDRMNEASRSLVLREYKNSQEEEKN